ncbi:hypothetical protein [Anaerosporobacter faecicola]|nr:hypothetical protein [Anaerosporobacter faecicola]
MVNHVYTAIILDDKNIVELEIYEKDDWKYISDKMYHLEGLTW